MKIFEEFRKSACILLVAGAATACGADQVNRNAFWGSAAPAYVPKVDNVMPQQLSAGLEVMKPRVLRIVDAFSRIEPTSEFRYFMHPATDRDAEIEFDISDLSSVTLSPRIGHLDRNCAQDPAAGEVQMSYAIDGGRVTRITVDRHYDRLIKIDAGGARKLRVIVNQGNGVITCDWFALGLSDVSVATAR